LEADDQGDGVHEEVGFRLASLVIGVLVLVEHGPGGRFLLELQRVQLLVKVVVVVDGARVLARLLEGQLLAAFAHAAPDLRNEAAQDREHNH